MAPLPFADLTPTPRAHFRLHALATATRVIEQAGRSLGSHEALLEQFPWVGGYLDEADRLGAPPGREADLDWAAAIEAWQRRAPDHLPLRALANATGLDFGALGLLVAVGLVEEDARFGALFELMQGVPGQQRPTPALLNAWWRDPVDDGGVQSRLRRLRELGLVDAVTGDAPRQQWGLQVPALVWDALRGDLSAAPAPYLRHHGAEDAPEPIVEAPLRETLAQLPTLLETDQVGAVVVRGPHHNGRRTLLRWLGRALGRGVLEVELAGKADVDLERLRLAAPLSTLLHALRVVVIDPAAGETIALPACPGDDAAIGVVMGRDGGLTGAAVDRALTITVDLPSPDARALQLCRALDCPAPMAGELAAHFRMTSGNLHRAARLGAAHARLAGRAETTPDDLRQAARTLGRQALDTLATRLPDSGAWSDFAAADETLRELRTLESRCRHRELLLLSVGGSLAVSLNCGVRALFQGPSGTGKTLAARLLASSLQKDLYRVDLAAVVNKYIGETEKNLSRIFAAAEELDIVVLFDEGDALLARRTGVSNANDRYANLETNFLLQRLESFEGIAIVTTNAAELIDGAFQRRMDVIVDFRPPEAAHRWAILQMHLPPGHAVDSALLREVAGRCQLTGGQLRNAVLHASLLALDEACAVNSSHLEEAVQREYRRSGGVCPLRWVVTPAARRG